MSIDSPPGTKEVLLLNLNNKYRYEESSFFMFYVQNT